MKNYLFITNGSKDCNYESKDSIELRNMSRCCIDPALDLGYNVFMSYNRKYADQIKVKNYDIKLYDANIYRNIFNVIDNYRAYKQLNTFLSKHKIDVIHCNTPIGGLLGRICGSKNHVRKIIYTAHGFHFYKGNNPVRNFIFRTIEKHLAKKTDTIITINNEDFEAAKEFKLKKGGEVFLVHGVGIDLDKYKNAKVNLHKKRKELGVSEQDIVLISVGDINKNKNTSLLLDVIKKSNNDKIKCIVCGTGEQINKMKRKSEKLGISSQVLFLGYRTDIYELMSISDIYISTSKREGLPRALMEAMASGLPCVVSDIRGNRDLITTNINGFLCDNVRSYLKAINTLTNDVNLSSKFAEYNRSKIKKYSTDCVDREMYKIYKKVLS